jgi:pyruvate dehydrogenase E2 component (dihydrolipoamide acetyltransferase)
MPAEVIMPALGMAQETGTVVRWLRSEGDVLVKGEPLLEVETDKVTVEIEAPADGMLSGVSAPEGTAVPVGTVIAVVVAQTDSIEVQHEPEPARSSRPLASPKARRLAENLGVAIDSIGGSGPGGAVVTADVAAAGASSTDSMTVGNAWRTMAGRVTQSWHDVPQFVLGREVDASQLVSWRAEARRRAPTKRTSHTDLLIKLCAEALRRHPRVNARWNNGSIVVSEGVNVGIAVATADSVVVPVVHHADKLDLDSISARREELVERARAGTLRPADVEGGTFTISNLGMYGVDYFQAIVNAPQAGILAVGRLLDRPLVAEGRLVARPTITVALSLDHRVVDGARGAEFLGTLADLIDDPAALVG